MVIRMNLAGFPQISLESHNSCGPPYVNSETSYSFSRTVQRRVHKTRVFITPDLWSPDSHYFITSDYKI